MALARQVMRLLLHLEAVESLKGPHLIVTPTPLLAAWEDTLEECKPGHPCYRYVGKKQRAAFRRDMRAGIIHRAGIVLATARDVREGYKDLAGKPSQEEVGAQPFARLPRTCRWCIRFPVLPMHHRHAGLEMRRSRDFSFLYSLLNFLVPPHA